MRAELGTGVALGLNLITFQSVENLGGTNHNDVLIGDDGPNFLDGGLGSETCSDETNYGCEGLESEPLF